MRIISNFRDYYDIGQNLGQDQSIVFVRKTVEAHWTTQRDEPRNGFTLVPIGFCGQIYCCFRATFSVASEWRTAWCYSLDDCDRFVEGLPKAPKDAYFGSPSDSTAKRFRQWFASGWDGFGLPRSRSELKAQFAKHRTADHSGRTELFHKHNAPIIAWTPQVTIVNPSLRQYEFFRIKEPYTAFQEIQQYVGGVLLVKTNPVPHVPDEVMQEIKGFDHKYSFRKEPRVIRSEPLSGDEER